MLTDKEILKYIKLKRISIDPFTGKNLKAGKYDIHLGQYLLKPVRTSKLIDPANENFKPEYKKIDLKSKPYILKPGEFVLGQTEELIGLGSNVGMILDGSTSMARIGISIHQSSMYLPPGQDPHIVTLEIFNAGTWKVKLSYGLRVGKLISFKFNGKNKIEAKTFNQYNGQKETTGAIFRK